MNREENSVKCCYCSFRFVPEPKIIRCGKRNMAYVECPRCGNGIERPARWYDYPGAGRKKVAVHG